MQTVFSRANMPAFNWEEWTLYCPKDVPRQITESKGVGVNCGVHACVWAYIICTSQEFYFSESDMNNARKWIFEKIIAAENIKFVEKLTFNSIQTTNKKIEICDISKINVSEEVPMGAESTFKYLAFLKYMVK